jgi:Ca2+-binding RTX toxin-like protein
MRGDRVRARSFGGALLVVLAAMYSLPALGLADVGPIKVDAINDQFARLNIEATSGNDAIVVGAERGEFVVDADQGVETSTCTSVSSSRVRCPHYSGYIPVFLFEGDDQLKLDSKHVRGRVDGGPGKDTLIGNRRHNFLYGGTEADQISGGAGPDRINGQSGRDAMSGQRGSDTILAIDGFRDKVISCGPGKDDVAYVDRGIDPKPVGCESVMYQLSN